MISIVRAARDEDAPYLVDAAGTVTLREAAALVRRAAGGLVRRGAPDADLVALRGANGRATLFAALACFELGVPFVPIHPRATDAEAARLVALSGASLVLDDAALSRLGEGAAWDGRREADPEAPAVVMYTSGTTGVPKGAELPQRALLASARASAVNLPFGDDELWLLALPLCHVGGLSIAIRCLLARRPFFLLPKFDVAEVARALDRATRASLVPTMLHDLLAHRVAPGKLRAALLGGAAASTKLLEDAAHARFPALTTYGLTEACSQVASQAPRDASVVELGVGKPLAGTTVTLVGDDGAPAPPGAIGEIVVDGPTLMLGYRGAPRPGGSFATGDLGRWDEAGHLHVVGRKSDLVVTGGENVYPREVEDALLGLRGVGAACVVGVPDARWGEIVAAAVVLDVGTGVEEVEQAARGVLAGFRLPRRWKAVAALPLGPTGKVDRRAVASALAHDR